MAFASIDALFEHIQAEAPKAYAAGIRFFVAVELKDGSWIALHGDDQGHCGRLAEVWVDQMGNRGASSWRLYPQGPDGKSFAQYYASNFEEEWI